MDSLSLTDVYLKHTHSRPFLDCAAEYASVGYMAKRIQMRKNRFLALQKMAEQKKNEAMMAAAAAAAAQAAAAAAHANSVAIPNDVDQHGFAKQTVRRLLCLT